MSNCCLNGDQVDGVSPSYAALNAEFESKDAALKQSGRILKRSGSPMTQTGTVLKRLAKQRRKFIAVTPAQPKLRAVLKNHHVFAVRLRLKLADAFAVDDR